MTLINSTHYPAVRAALDTSLDATMLPDSVIAMQIYQDRAEVWVTDQDANAATRTGAEQTHIENAVIFKLASLLAPAVPQIVESHVDRISYKRNVDWEARAEQLREMAEQEMADVLTPSDATPRMPAMFTVATGTRGR